MNVELKNKIASLKIAKAEYEGEIEFNEGMMEELLTDLESGEEKDIDDLTEKQQKFYFSLKYGQGGLRNKIKRIDCQLKALAAIE